MLLPSGAKSRGWLGQKGGNGYVLEACDGTLDEELKVKHDGKLTKRLMGMDIRNQDGQRIPYWIDYRSLQLNDKVIFAGSKPQWHDAPYVVTESVKGGDTVKLHVEWLPLRADHS